MPATREHRGDPRRPDAARVGLDRWRRCPRRRATGIAAALTVVLAGATSGGEHPITVDGDGLRIGIDAATGGLVELVTLPVGTDAPADEAAPTGPWRLDVGGGNERHELAAERCGPPTVHRLPDGDVTLAWPEVAAGTLGGIRVDVRVRPGSPRPGLSRWELRVAKPKTVRLLAVDFPRVAAIGERPNETLAVPKGLGMVTRNPRRLAAAAAGRRLSWTYPKPLSLQFIALYEPGGPGFYAGCDDTGGCVKDLVLAAGPDGRLVFECRHAPEGEAHGEEEYRLPFAGVIGGFRGDWSTAAALYRDSPTGVEIARRGRLGRGAVPEWLAGTGMWVWNRGRSPDVIPAAIGMQGRIEAPVSVLWHWWHGCGYDEGFPEYLPPREGTDAFRAALDTARRHDVRAILYMNQRLWGTRTASWKAGPEPARHAVKRRDGRVQEQTYNRFTGAACAAMCLGTEFWRDTYAGIAGTAVRELGAAGIYMDQAGTPDECHDAGHGHPVGRGRYGHGGLARLADDIRGAGPPDRPVALAGEHCGEPWIGVLDAQLALGVSAERIGLERDWEPAPIYPAVYHGSTIVFGSYASLEHPPYDEKWPAERRPAAASTPLDPRFGRQFMLEQARAFAWGMQPMIANVRAAQFDEQPDAMAFAIRLARTRMRGLAHLRDGTWLPPPAIVAPTREIDVVEAGVYSGVRRSTRVVPLVLCTAWRAADGMLGIAVAHVGDEDVVVEIPVNAAEYGLRGGHAVRVVDHAGRRHLTDLAEGESPVRCPMPARSGCLLEFVPRADR